MSYPLLSVSKLRSGYGAGDVLRDVFLQLSSKEIVGVIGRNGAGKSTLMRTLIGLLKCRQGQINFNGEELAALPPEERARKGLGYVPQGRHVFPGLTVHENLRSGRFVGNALDFDLIYSTFPVLQERSHQLAGTLSGGQQEMLAIGRALIGGPRLLLLDEPSEGVQPSIVQEIGDALVRLNRDRGLSVLLVEQNLDLMQYVTHRAYVLDKGAISAELNRSQINNEALLTEYLTV